VRKIKIILSKSEKKYSVIAKRTHSSNFLVKKDSCGLLIIEKCFRKFERKSARSSQGNLKFKLCGKQSFQSTKSAKTISIA